MKNGCIKELKRLKRHYKEEYNESSNKGESGMYLIGVADGLDMAIDVLMNEKYYNSAIDK